MAKKIFINDNILFVTEPNQQDWQLPSKSVRYQDNNNNSVFLSDRMGIYPSISLDVSNTTNEFGVPYDITTLTDFLNENTGGAEGGVNSTLYSSVKDFGAVGDGVADDTQAFEDAKADALTKNKVVFVPKGTFLIKRGFVLQDNMQLIGIKGESIITKPQAVTQLIQANVTQGDTTVTVVDGSLYEIGQAFYMGEDDRMNSYQGTSGVITGISGNIITFEADRSTGAKNNYAVGSTMKFSSIFSMVTTNSTKYGAKNILIDGITLAPNITATDMQCYNLAPINTDPQTSSEPIIGEHIGCTVRNVEILESHTDGISLQSAGDILIESCKVDNITNKGIHFGTTCENITIRNSNYIYNCGEGGIFWCYGNNKILVDGNFFKGNAKSCFGFEAEDNNTTIVNNFFEDEYTSFPIYPGSKNINISNNTFTKHNAPNVNSRIIHIDRASFITVDNNIFEGWQATSDGYAIAYNNCNNISIVNNDFNDFIGRIAIADLNSNGATTDSEISNNNITGEGVGINLVNTKDSNILENIIETDSTTINVGADCYNLSLTDNKVKTPIVNNGTLMKINSIYYDVLNGVAPNPLIYDLGSIVKDTTNDDIFFIAKSGLDWHKVVSTEVDGINNAYKNGVETIPIVNAVETNGTITKNASDINLHSPASGNLVIVTDTQVDLTSVSKIFVEWEQNGSGQNYVYSHVGVGTSKLDATFVESVSIRRVIFNRMVTELDVSELTGNHYLKIRGQCNATSECNLTVYRLGYK